MREIDFINAKLNNHCVTVPQRLYKYRPFDGFALDMLENGYVYLCPAEKLDDPSECKVDFSLQDFYDLESGAIKLKCVDMILDTVKPHTSEGNFQVVKSYVHEALMPNGLVKRNVLLDVAMEIQEIVPELNIVPLVNFLGNIPESLDDPNNREQLEKMLSIAYYARQKMGICSLSELKGSSEMWNKYADSEKGYCIEYDMQNYENSELLFPVVYNDNRETNILINMLSTFIGQMIFGISNGQIEADRSQYFQMFLTKDTMWNYQKEWRLIGDAGDKLSAPSISAIYLGKNMDEQNKKQLIEYCQSHQITYKTAE